MNRPEIIEKGNEPAVSFDGIDLTLIRWMLPCLRKKE